MLIKPVMRWQGNSSQSEQRESLCLFSAHFLIEQFRQWAASMPPLRQPSQRRPSIQPGSGIPFSAPGEDLFINLIFNCSSSLCLAM
jgi:hypothetical protein